MKHIGLYQAYPENRRPLSRFRRQPGRNTIATEDERVSDLNYSLSSEAPSWSSRLATTYAVWGTFSGLDFQFRVGFIARLKFNERIGQSSWWGITERQAMLGGHFWELEAGHQETAREEVANFFTAEARLHDEAHWLKYSGEPWPIKKRLEHFLKYLTPTYTGRKVCFADDVELVADSQKALLLNAIAGLPTFLAETRGHVQHPETLGGLDREIADLDFLEDSLIKFLQAVQERKSMVNALKVPLVQEETRKSREAHQRWEEDRAAKVARDKATLQAKNLRSQELTGQALDSEGPTAEKLRALVWEMPLTKVAARFGISDVMVKKHCKRWDIPTPPQGFFLMSAEKRENVRRNQNSS